MNSLSGCQEKFFLPQVLSSLTTIYIQSSVMLWGAECVLKFHWQMLTKEMSANILLQEASSE
jgi:hypothetical protein